MDLETLAVGSIDEEGAASDYIVGVTDEMVVFAEEPRWVEPRAGTGGRPRKRHRLAEGSPEPAPSPSSSRLHAGTVEPERARRKRVGDRK